MLEVKVEILQLFLKEKIGRDKWLLAVYARKGKYYLEWKAAAFMIFGFKECN